MVFELSESLVNGIIFAMENQDGVFAVDSLGPVVTAVGPEGAEIVGDRYYPIPQWDSAAGYAVMETFAARLHNPPAKEALNQVLFSGKGVFRNFKQVLKDFPAVEKLWIRYKRREMLRVINVWYNSLREIWGLEKAGEEPEDTEDLVRDDFIFRPLKENIDKELLLTCRQLQIEEYQDSFPQKIGRAMRCFVSRHPVYTADGIFGFAAEAVSGESAGYVALDLLAEDTALLTGLYVFPSFRGLGLGSALLSAAIKTLSAKAFRCLIAADYPLPDASCLFLLHNGFSCINGVYAAQL